MRVAIPKESVPGELRVAVVPESVARLRALGAEVVVEKGAGAAAFFSDPAYAEAGAVLVGGRRRALSQAELVLQVRAPQLEPGGVSEIASLPAGCLLVGLLQPRERPELLRALAARGVTAFSLELMPRISRAQDMDVLSSMSTVAGYYAVILAASRLPKLFPLMMTAAGTITPARVLVLGAGVAGLQAIATARRLGAVVRAFDVRPAVREQVESLGAGFVELEQAVEAGEVAGGYAKEISRQAQRHEQEALAEEVGQADVVICTALIPGRPAPTLVTTAAVGRMRPGSVIVDLAAEAGGNCQLTRPGSELERQGVLVLGPLNVPSRVAHHASQLFSRNVTRFAATLIRDGQLLVDLEDPVVAATCVTRSGEVVLGRSG